MGGSRSRTSKVTSGPSTVSASLLTASCTPVAVRTGPSDSGRQMSARRTASGSAWTASAERQSQPRRTPSARGEAKGHQLQLLSASVTRQRSFFNCKFWKTKSVTLDGKLLADSQLSQNTSKLKLVTQYVENSDF